MTRQKQISAQHLQLRVESEAKSIIQAATHAGEVGRDLEKVVINLLRPLLPSNIGIGTGFIKSYHRPGWVSPQIDIIFYRSDVSAPLFSGLTFQVYPFESVIGIMMVTKHLTKGKLISDLEKVRLLKSLTQRRYLVHTPRARVLDGLTLQPRLHYFAFSTQYKKASSLAKLVHRIHARDQIMHLHSLYVLGHSLHEVAMPNPPTNSRSVKFYSHEPDAFVSFCSKIVYSLSSYTGVVRGGVVMTNEYAVNDLGRPLRSFTIK